MNVQQNNQRRITIHDIARLAGVAISTVSEVINDNRKMRVAPKTEARIREVIRKLHYVPMQAARSLVNQRTRQIGFLVSSTATLGLANNFYSMMLAGVESVCSRMHYKCVVGKYDFISSVRDFVFPDSLRQHSVDALLIAGWMNPQCRSKLDSLGVPIVTLGDDSQDGNDDGVFKVCNDFEKNYFRMFGYLNDLGHRQFLIPVSNTVETQRISMRLAKFNSESSASIAAVFPMNEQGLDEFGVGQALAVDVFKQGLYGDSTVLLANDQICCGFIQKMYKLGRRCPEDFSVLATDDTALCEWNAVPLSALGTNQYEEGRIATELLISLLEGKSTPQECAASLAVLNAPHSIIVRDSCAPIRKSSLRKGYIK